MLLFAAFALGLALTGCSEAKSINPQPREKRIAVPHECPPCATYACPEGYYATYEPYMTMSLCSCPVFKECVQSNTKKEPMYLGPAVSLIRKKRRVEPPHVTDDPCFEVYQRACTAGYTDPPSPTCPEGCDLLSSTPMSETNSGHLCRDFCADPIYTCYNKETDEYCNLIPASGEEWEQEFWPNN